MSQPSFRNISMEALSTSYNNWRRTQRFIYERKGVVNFSKHLISRGEYCIRFYNEIADFRCNDVLSPIKLASRLFFTTTLGDEPLGNNPKADGYRLEQFLIEFDEKFYALVEERIEDCGDGFSPVESFF